MRARSLALILSLLPATVVGAQDRTYVPERRAVLVQDVDFYGSDLSSVFDTTREAFSLARATGDVLLLELAVQPPSPLPIRSYDVASGRLVHVSASRRDSSFRTMALGLLRSFGRTDAAPLFAEATRAGDFAARWSALREFVALDPAAARPRVEAMAASDPHPEIRRAAIATLALYAVRKAEPCPA